MVTKKPVKKVAAKKAPAKKAPAKKAVKKVAAKKAPAKKAVKKVAAKKVVKKAKTPRKPNAAFMAPKLPQGPLAAIVGDKALPRTEITKKIWDYIKKNKLQDSVNKRMINADEKLKALFGKAQASMFELTKFVSKHVK